MNKILASLVLVPFLLIGCATNLTLEQQDAYQQLAVITGVSYAVMAYIEDSDNPKKTAQEVINFIDHTLDPQVPNVDVSKLSPKDQLLVNTIIEVIKLQVKDNDYTLPANVNLLKHVRTRILVYTL